MSQATVGRIVDDLLTQSILAEVGVAAYPPRPDSPQLGRPSKLLELDRAKRRFLLIHLGVRQTRLAAMPVAIPETDRWEIEFNTPRFKEQWFAKLARACRKMPLRGIDAIILSCPGVVDESAGRVLLCPNIHWAEQANFTSGLRSLARLPVVFLQEIRALALGQLAIEPILKDFLLVDFGDGVGGASIVGAKLETGHLPLSGELGHTPVLGNDRRCGCGSIGCTETLISRKGLLKSFHENTGLRSWNALIAQVERNGLPEWFRTSLDAVAITVAGALNVEGIANAIFTGFLSEFPPTVTDYLCEKVRRHAMWSRLGEVRASISPRHRMAGMICAGIDRVLFSVEV
ncbi:MAG TPA: ROK family protein [Tepidisphaeraceae bacterium]|nr:ROK family protein [Tepidisphaeraceae bacterium]